MERVEITADEVSTIITLVSGLDPDIYSHPAAKAVIYKIRAAGDDATFVVQPRF